MDTGECQRKEVFLIFLGSENSYPRRYETERGDRPHLREPAEMDSSVSFPTRTQLELSFVTGKFSEQSGGVTVRVETLWPYTLCDCCKFHIGQTSPSWGTAPLVRFQRIKTAITKIDWHFRRTTTDEVIIWIGEYLSRTVRDSARRLITHVLFRIVVDCYRCFMFVRIFFIATFASASMQRWLAPTSRWFSFAT
jgi:hypothetical protein